MSTNSLVVPTCPAGCTPELSHPTGPDEGAIGVMLVPAAVPGFSPYVFTAIVALVLLIIFAVVIAVVLRHSCLVCAARVIRKVRAASDAGVPVAVAVTEAVQDLRP